MKFDKAKASDYLGRFREIISDPLNMLIPRHPLAGTVDGNNVYLHNGLKVPIAGEFAYYDRFSDILIINRGVHEPLEEYIFMKLLERLPYNPSMLELGAYWGHYSMWLLMARPSARCILVEPEQRRLKAGRNNFKNNAFTAKFIQATIGQGKASVPSLLEQTGNTCINILHSDIQGAEVEMLLDATQLLSERKIDYCLISTHSQDLHRKCKAILEGVGYKVEVSSDFDLHTTSHDGLLFASSPVAEHLFKRTAPCPLGRIQITSGISPREVVAYLQSLSNDA